MQRQLLLFLSILILLVSVFVLIFKDSRGLDRLVHLGSKITLPYQNNQSMECAPPKYTFPKEALISEEPLPDKVKNSFKNVINIVVCFSMDRKNLYFSAEPMQSSGTASMFEPGLFISAEHIFLIDILDLEHRGQPFFIDQKGLPRSNHYRYTFYGTASINGQAVTFPLELIAMGDPYRPQDLAVFRATNLPPQLVPLEFGEPASLNDIVYSSGRVPLVNFPNNLNPTSKPVLSDFINFNFKGRVTGIITDLPNNAITGFEKIYGIKTNIEPGFSGGPVFNKDGKIIGLTVSTSPGLNFAQAISAEDQQLFIEKLRNKGVIPKK